MSVGRIGRALLCLWPGALAVDRQPSALSQRNFAGLWCSPASPSSKQARPKTQAYTQTLLGISMGGWLCLRAAAFEPRIKRVIAHSVSFDVIQYTNIVGQLLAKLFFRKFRKFTNNAMVKKMKKNLQYSWFVNNLMYITNKEVPIEGFDVLLQLNEENLYSNLVKQDVLILTGRKDHLVPFKMHNLQVKALVNARSVTARIFTKEEHAENHCQIGNIGLALDVMVKWIDGKS
jgi:pimeloyl-ACP methyl ester carboxylesterase